MSRRLAWLLVALLGCAEPYQDVVHAEAWVGPGRHARDEVSAILAEAPVSVDGPGNDGRFRVIASHRALDELEAHGLEVHIQRADHRSAAARAPGYHDEDQMADALREIAEDHPDSAELVDLGRSVDGRPLLGLRIGEGDWRVRVLAAHHGDELSSAELALSVAEGLLADPVDAEVWVVPHVNPDGVAGGTRYNANAVDLNRNYGFEWSDDEYRAGDAPFSEPESRAMRVLSSYRGFASGLSMHAGAALICYVWNYTTQPSTDEGLLVAQSEAYLQRCDVDGFYHINGGAWYVTYGDTTDWSYGRQGTLDYTLEVSVDKTPPTGELERMIDDHRDAVMHFIQREPALVGSVRDAGDDRPVEATITPVGGQGGTAGPDGRFARWYPAGELQLEVGAPGYRSQTVELELEAGVNQRLDVVLERDGLIQLRPEPVLLTWGDSARELVLPGIDDEQVTLFRAGYPDVTLSRAAESFTVVPSELEPGPWGVHTGQGSAPRSLFVGERDDRVRLTRVEWQEETISVEGQGFEVGTRAWAVVGDTRGLMALEILSATKDSLLLDAQPLASEQGVVDLLVVSSGAQLAALDLAAGSTVDTGAPSDTQAPETDSPPPEQDSSLPEVGGVKCGCATSSSSRLAPGLFLVTLACVCGLRRRERNPRRRRVSVEPGLRPARSRDLDAPWELS